MIIIKLTRSTVLFLLGFLAASVNAQPLSDVECVSPPAAVCDREAGCDREDSVKTGNAVDPETQRNYFIDFPCDLAPDETVNFILSIHGAGSIGNWHRHYFPAFDYVDDFNLVIATPTSLRDGPGPIPMWSSRDDGHLQNIVNQVVAHFGRDNIRSFWLAGHSQGGMTSNRLICTPFFRDKVDGWLSLSGGRLGPVKIPDDFFGDNPPPRSLTDAMDGSGASFGRAAVPDCDFSYIFTSGENEIIALPDTSPWAQKYACDARQRLPDIVDMDKGYVSARDPNRGASWGGAAKPGTANQYIYPACTGDRLVADVIRLDKGHTEGLEPEVTRRLLEMMVNAPAGKLRANR